MVWVVNDFLVIFNTVSKLLCFMEPYLSFCGVFLFQILVTALIGRNFEQSLQISITQVRALRRLALFFTCLVKCRLHRLRFLWSLLLSLSHGCGHTINLR